MLKTTTLLLLLASIIDAAPTQKEDKPFTIPLERKEAKGPKDPKDAADKAKKHAKFKYPDPQTGVNTVPTGPVTQGISPYYDVTYTGTFQFGTPAQSFPLIVDTGSAQFWLYSQKCSTCGKGYVDTTKSSTFHNSSVPLKLAYGDGSTYVTGFIGTDRIGFANVFTDGASVGIMDQSAHMDLENTSAGISGWSWPITQSSGTSLNPLPYTQATNGQWSNKQFGMYLNRAGYTAQKLGVASKRTTGALTINGVDSNFYSGTIQYFPRKVLDSRTSFAWGLDLDGVSVNGKFFSTKGYGAVMDSGTTYIYGPKAIVQALYAQIPGAVETEPGFFSLPSCGTGLKVSFRFGGKDFPIFGADLNRIISADGKCQGTIAYDDGLGFGNNWLVGDAFLKSYYTAYSYSPAQIGFAPVKAGL